ELNPVFVRQWHSYIERTGKEDRQFAVWRAFAALSSSEFALKAPEVMDRLTATGVVNGAIAQEFAAKPPASMAGVAERYGRIFSAAYGAWENALESAKAAGTDPPARLADSDQEALRQVLFGPDSPIHLPVSKPDEAEFFFAEQAREELGQAQARIDQW